MNLKPTTSQLRLLPGFDRSWEPRFLGKSTRGTLSFKNIITWHVFHPIFFWEKKNTNNVLNRPKKETAYHGVKKTPPIWSGGLESEIARGSWTKRRRLQGLQGLSPGGKGDGLHQHLQFDAMPIFFANLELEKPLKGLQFVTTSDDQKSLTHMFWDITHCCN